MCKSRSFIAARGSVHRLLFKEKCYIRISFMIQILTRGNLHVDTRVLWTQSFRRRKHLMPIDLLRANNNKCKHVLGVDRIPANPFNTLRSRIYDWQRLITKCYRDKLDINTDKGEKFENLKLQRQINLFYSNQLLGIMIKLNILL